MNWRRWVKWRSWVNWRWWFYQTHYFLFGQRQTCPRRMTEWGPWERNERLDWWSNASWSRFLVLHDKLRGWLSWQWRDGRWQRGFYGGTRWHWPWRPRTCSFCGGVHPEDAIRLIREGWDSEKTDKGYKWYLNPPGYWEWRQSWRKFDTREQMIATGKVGDYVKPFPRLPVPPVKLYVQHFSPEQIDRFNAALRECP